MTVNLKIILSHFNSDAKPGENVSLPGLEYKAIGNLTSTLNEKKFKKYLPNFKSDDNKNCLFGDLIMSSPSGPLRTTTLQNCPIS